jgi:methyl-accepting chemotaxis protein
LIEDSVSKVEAGYRLVETSGEALQQILSSVKRVTDFVGEIAAASREQSTGIDQVNSAVTQMDQVTQTNAAQTEELSGTAEELAQQGRQLLDVVSQFNLRHDDAIGRVLAARQQRPAPRLSVRRQQAPKRAATRPAAGYAGADSEPDITAVRGGTHRRGTNGTAPASGSESELDTMFEEI